MTFRWVEFKHRPKRDGLHDSGYRFLRVVGVRPDGQRVETHEWADHIYFNSPTNVDVEADGTIRVMARNSEGWSEPSYYYQSDAEFEAEK